jgi:hypothetical protein
MDLGSLLDNSKMPGFEFARDDVKAQVRQSQSLGNGVDFFSGHDGGVAFRIFNIAEKNEVLSKKLGYAKFDSVEMIQWFVDSKMKPVARLTELPEELLSFDPITKEANGGKYLNEYLNSKQGREAPGLPLSQWGEIEDCDLQTLVSSGIFSVEQLAAQPDEKINRFHDTIKEAFVKAVQFVNGKQNRVESEKIALELLEVTQKNSKLEDALAAQQAQINELMKAAPEAVISRKGGK